jgi:ADP-ribosylglycohydrolase
MPSLAQRFRGSLLGLAVGDGLGSRFEGQSAEAIQNRFPDPLLLIQRPPNYELYYTDDTQMMIGVAETLVEAGQLEDERQSPASLCSRTHTSWPWEMPSSSAATPIPSRP